MGFSVGILQHVHFGTGNKLRSRRYAQNASVSLYLSTGAKFEGSTDLSEKHVLCNRKTTTKNTEQRTKKEHERTNHNNNHPPQPPPPATTQQQTTNNKQTTKQQQQTTHLHPYNLPFPRNKHHTCGMIHLQCCDVCRFKSKGSRGDLRQRIWNQPGCLLCKTFPMTWESRKTPRLSIGILAV